MITLTDKLDGIFTEEDKARRNSVFIQCRDCNTWTHFDLTDKTQRKCSKCGHANLDPNTTISERTFDPLAKSKKRTTREPKTTKTIKRK